MQRISGNVKTVKTACEHRKDFKALTFGKPIEHRTIAVL